MRFDVLYCNITCNFGRGTKIWWRFNPTHLERSRDNKACRFACRLWPHIAKIPLLTPLAVQPPEPILDVPFSQKDYRVICDFGECVDYSLEAMT